MELNDSLEFFAPLAAIFDELGIEYRLGGSVASSVYGMPRGTNDVDVEAAIGPQHVEELVRLLEDEWIITPEMVRDAMHRRASFNLIPYDGIAKIDVFFSKGRAFDLSAAQRRQRNVVLEDGTVSPFWYDSPEDTILRKLEWYRIGGETSNPKWLDVLAILKAQTFDIDLDYLEKWARELKVSDLLNRALDQSGLKT